jgi:hypothetical protein
MKNFFLISLCILVLQVCYGQHQIYFGLYTSGHIEQYSPIATAPYYIDLNYYTISFLPKIGYQYKNITVGGIASYTFHKNTFQNLEPTFGIGYFCKYHFGKTEIKHKWLKQPILMKWFVEWRQIINNGYYERAPDWRMRKVSTATHLKVLQVGGDLFLSKSFSVGMGVGVGAIQFLDDVQNPSAGKHYTILPNATLTFQYNLKL